MTDTETFSKVSYIAMEEPLTWYEYFFGKSEAEIEADPRSKSAKFKVTQQIKTSANSHALMKMKMKKHQACTSFDHTQSVVKTDLKFEDRTSELPSPYQLPKNPPQFPVPKKLHPSIAQIRNKRFITTKDDIDL